MSQILESGLANQPSVEGQPATGAPMTMEDKRTHGNYIPGVSGDKEKADRVTVETDFGLAPKKPCWVLSGKPPDPQRSPSVANMRSVLR